MPSLPGLLSSCGSAESCLTCRIQDSSSDTVKVDWSRLNAETDAYLKGAEHDAFLASRMMMDLAVPREAEDDEEQLLAKVLMGCQALDTEEEESQEVHQLIGNSADAAIVPDESLRQTAASDAARLPMEARQDEHHLTEDPSDDAKDLEESQRQAGTLECTVQSIVDRLPMEVDDLGCHSRSELRNGNHCQVRRSETESLKTANQVEQVRLKMQEQLAKEKIQAFLAAHGFRGGVSAKRRRLMWTITPLHAAVKEADADMARLLLAAKADPLQKNSSGRTPMELATKCNKRGSHDKVLAVLRNSSKLPV